MGWSKEQLANEFDRVLRNLTRERPAATYHAKVDAHADSTTSSTEPVMPTSSNSYGILAESDRWLEIVETTVQSAVRCLFNWHGVLSKVRLLLGHMLEGIQLVLSIVAMIGVYWYFMMILRMLSTERSDWMEEFPQQAIAAIIITLAFLAMWVRYRITTRDCEQESLPIFSACLFFGVLIYGTVVAIEYRQFLHDAVALEEPQFFEVRQSRGLSNSALLFLMRSTWSRDGFARLELTTECMGCLAGKKFRLSISSKESGYKTSIKFRPASLPYNQTFRIRKRDYEAGLQLDLRTFSAATTAVCGDGWESTSTGNGTCSWHGGVSEYLKW